MTGRIYAIGDLHGCSDHLDQLLRKIPFDPDLDQFVFMGDYIDRGPDSFGVVDRLLDLKRFYPNTMCLLGNHEQMLQDYLSGEDTFSFVYNGGRATLESYSVENRQKRWHGTLPPEHENFFRHLPRYYETEDYIFVHAGLRPGVLLEDQSPHDLIWIRDQFFKSDYDFGKTVVFGHTPFQRPFVVTGRIGIDTGAVYGNVLTCVALPEMVFYHV